MQADIDNLRSLRANGFTVAPAHGEAPETTFTQYTNSWRGIGIGIIVAFLIFFICWAALSFKHADHKILSTAAALNYGLSIGIWVALLYYIYPVFAVLFKMVKNRQWPSKVILSQYSTAQLYLSSIVFAFILCFLLNSAAGIVISRGFRYEVQHDENWRSNAIQLTALNRIGVANAIYTFDRRGTISY